MDIPMNDELLHLYLDEVISCAHLDVLSVMRRVDGELYYENHCMTCGSVIDVYKVIIEPVTPEVNKITSIAVELE